MGKEKKQKKKKSGGLLKRLGLTFGIAAFVIIIAVVIINAVNKSTIKYITVEGAYKELYVGNPEFGSAEIGVNVYPSTASTSSLYAYSSNDKVAKVTFNGATLVIEAVGTGSCTINVQHASKSSLKDAIQIEVKDVDIEDLNFVQTNEDGEYDIINKVDVKKDGFEHHIKFDMDPIDANMNNLKVVYDATVLENAYINQDTKSLVVVPKTDIVQTSTVVDVEIYQNTTEGVKSAQYARLQLNLLAREAYIRFNLSHQQTTGYSLNHSNIVYLEEDNAHDVYVKPDIGYDVNYDTIGTFTPDEYNLYIDGELVDWSNSNTYNHMNKLNIDKSSYQYYYFNVLNNFKDGDNIYVTFEHIFTGVTNSLQFIYLKTSVIGLSTENTFFLTTSPDLELNQDVALSFSNYDNAVKYKVVDVYAFKEEIVNGKVVRVKVESFGDDYMEETIQIKKVSDKMFARAVNVTENTFINFGAESLYWDSRYVNFGIEETFITIKFTVKSEVTDIVVQNEGKELHSFDITKGETKSVEILGLPFGNNNLKVNEVTFDVKKADAETSEVVVEFNPETQKFDIKAQNVASGTYVITFKYNLIETKLYVKVN